MNDSELNEDLAGILIDREHEIPACVAELTAAGWKARDIGRVLGISARTVKRFRAKQREQEAGIKGAAEAMRRALEPE